MTKRAYFNLAMQQRLSWLIGCAAHPSSGMSKMHVRIVRLAIRTKMGAEPAYDDEPNHKIWPGSRFDY